MVIKLYKTKSENEVVKKVLTDEIVLEGTMRESSSILNFSMNVEHEDLSSYNYAYIESFHRYYYISDIVIVRTGLWRLSLTVDVLMTYKNDFLPLKAIVSRQEKRYNLYLRDDNMKVYNNPIVVTKEFPSGFSSTLTTLMTIAGTGEAVHSTIDDIIGG